VILASGSTEIKEGEPVVVFCIEDALHKIEKLFVKKGIL
jgi:Trk K+ transport system NAD-binding subunit